MAVFGSLPDGDFKPAFPTNSVVSVALARIDMVEESAIVVDELALATGVVSRRWVGGESGGGLLKGAHGDHP